MIEVKISAEPLSIDAAYASVVDPACGGVALFVGTVRDCNKGEEVTHLDFEAYGVMAEQEMRKIAERCRAECGAVRVSMHHRVGEVGISGIAVVIAVSAVHRREAFVACEYAIDQLKLHVPIWKREHLVGGSCWVGSRP